MGNERKRRGWMFWTGIAVVGLIVGYPLSIGPAIALCSLLDMPDWGAKIYNFVYSPIIYFDNHEPRIIGRIFARYVEWCAGMNEDDRLSRLVVGAVIGVATIALVIWIVNKRVRPSSRPNPDATSESN
jgi:hypothetical protein